MNRLSDYLFVLANEKEWTPINDCIQWSIAGERDTLAYENWRYDLDWDTLADTIIAHHERFIIAVQHRAKGVEDSFQCVFGLEIKGSGYFDQKQQKLCQNYILQANSHQTQR